ncbi:MAG: hypothetical protein GYA24_21030 [Candidatus Lokiarchaeota archaeon]|nr:hypothetical protein [Candidatus Lokiarchaeota archaeon]
MQSQNREGDAQDALQEANDTLIAGIALNLPARDITAPRLLDYPLVNKHPDPPVTCDLGMLNLPVQIDGMILDGDSVDAFNDTMQPTRVVPREHHLPVEGGRVVLLAHALVFLTFAT